MMFSLRSLAEHLTHGLVIKRRLPSRFRSVPMYVSTEGGLRYLRLDLEKVDPELLNMAAELVGPGDVVWDVGANLGLFTFAAAARADVSGRVWAFEPDAWLVNLLRRSAAIKQSGRAPVEVLPVAVSDNVAMSRFYVAKRARAANYLQSCGSSQTGGERETQWVMTVTLDWLLNHAAPPNVLKIDVEGAEALVLAGATDLLTRFRPRILCEVYHENASRISSLLHSFGYVLYDAAEYRAIRTPIVTPAYSTVALPSPA